MRQCAPDLSQAGHRIGLGHSTNGPTSSLTFTFPSISTRLHPKNLNKSSECSLPTLHHQIPLQKKWSNSYACLSLIEQTLPPTPPQVSSFFLSFHVCRIHCLVFKTVPVQAIITATTTTQKQEFSSVIRPVQRNGH